MNILNWFKKADAVMRQTIFCFALSLLLIFCVGLPLKEKGAQKRVELAKQKQRAAKYLRAERALLGKNDVVAALAEPLSVVGFLEQVSAQLRLEKKMLRVTPDDSGVHFEMKGVNLEEVAALLAQVEQTDAGATLTFLQLIPETEKATQFSLQAKLEKF